MTRWLVTRFFWWQNALWIVVGAVTWLWLTPSLDRFAAPAPWAVALVYARNVGLMIVIVGGLHWWLHMRRSQGTQHKYDERWLSVGRRPFPVPASDTRQRVLVADERVFDRSAV